MASANAATNPEDAAGSKWKFVLRALKYRNFRLFFMGQSISLIGTWMQQIAMQWLVYRLSQSPFMLGAVVFCGQLPSLLLAPVAGIYADRWNRQRILIVTQSLPMVHAFILAALVLTNTVALWQIFPLSIFLGCVNAFDLPARQSLYIDMIERREDLGNAIALNSSMVNGARLVGPSIAGVIIASWGEGICFLLNGLSYWAVLASLLAMRLGTVKHKREGVPGNVWAGIKEGFAYVSGFAPIRAILLLMALVSLMGVPYATLMPVFARQVLGGGPHTYGFLMAAVGVGAFFAAVYLAARRSVLGLGRFVAFAAGLFGAALIAFACSRTLWLSMVFLALGGFGMITVLAASNTILQTIVEDNKRGRVMSFYSMAFMGMVPLGGLLAGALASQFGAPATVALGGFCCVAGALRFAGKLAGLRELVRPIYMAKGILPAADPDPREE